MNENAIPEAANAAVVDNAANAVVDNAVKAENLLNAAKNTAEGSRKRQKELFSTHFGGTEDLSKVKKRAEIILANLDSKVAEWKSNLTILLEAIRQKEATAGFDNLLSEAQGLTPELKAKLLAALQPAE